MKRGFTLVELITTFALTAVIIVLLLNVVIIIRNLYTSSNVKTQLYKGNFVIHFILKMQLYTL